MRCSAPRPSSPALLVVDNCEHVTAAAADAIDRLLAACQSPTVLATSRSPLDLPGESLVVLGPLGVPAPGSIDIDSDSVRLFVERAKDAGASITDERLDDVAQLCRHLDGVPLAIELAAARTRTMQPGEIVARLGVDIDVLARPRLRGDQRHRSVADTIEWSYRLLPDHVARMFDRLGVFAGPFTADLAYGVGADVGLDDRATADALQLLVDSSLVSAEPTADTTRFRLLETIKSFAVRRLGARGHARRGPQPSRRPRGRGRRGDPRRQPPTLGGVPSAARRCTTTWSPHCAGAWPTTTTAPDH